MNNTNRNDARGSNASQAVASVSKGDMSLFGKWLMPGIALILLGVVTYLLSLVAGDFLGEIHNYVKSESDRRTIVRIIIFLCFVTVAIKLFVARSRSTYERRAWGVATFFSVIDLVGFPILARIMGQFGEGMHPYLFSVLGAISWLCSLSGMFAAAAIVIHNNKMADAEHIVQGDSKARSATNRVAAAKMLAVANVEAQTEMWRAAAEVCEAENQKLAEAGVQDFKWTVEMVFDQMMATANKGKTSNEQTSPRQTDTQEVLKFSRS